MGIPSEICVEAWVHLVKGRLGLMDASGGYGGWGCGTLVETGGLGGRLATMRNDVCDAMAPRRPSQVHRVSSELHLSESPV